MNAPPRLATEHFLGEFARVADRLPGHARPELHGAREAALAEFARRGYPSVREEDWKYTSLAGLERQRLPILAAIPDVLTEALVESFALPGASLLVFLEGVFQPRWSRLDNLPTGVTVTSLGAEVEGGEAVLPELFPATSAFDALNQAFFTDGAVIRVAAGTVVEAPIQLLFLAGGSSRAIHTRNQVVAEAESAVTVIEHHAAVGDEVYCTNVVTAIAAGGGARIEHLKLQEEGSRAFHFCDLKVVQEAGSRFASSSFALGSALARVDISVSLAAEDASCILNGLYFAGGRQHLDHHTRIDHLQPRCRSRELYKGILAGAGRAVFNGKVIVHPAAQQSDAFQSNRNLLLSPDAEVDTKPELEIYADDVKCGHGATVGQFDPVQLFYLRSRGIGLETARQLLTLAFAREVAEPVDFMPLRKRLEQALTAKLPAEVAA